MRVPLLVPQRLPRLRPGCVFQLHHCEAVMKLLEAGSNAELFRAKKLRERFSVHRSIISGMMKQWMRSLGSQQKSNRDKVSWFGHLVVESHNILLHFDDGE